VRIAENINVQNANGSTALHLAVKTNNVETCRLLCQCPHINVNIKDKRMQNTPLHHAIDNIELVRILCSQANVDINAQNCNKQTVLHCAIIKACDNVVAYLCTINECNVNARTVDHSPLTLALVMLNNNRFSTRRANIVNTLLQQWNIDVNCSNEPVHPIHWLCQMQIVTCVCAKWCERCFYFII
jgi:ankyrin repeat protein